MKNDAGLPSLSSANVSASSSSLPRPVMCSGSVFQPTCATTFSSPTFVNNGTNLHARHIISDSIHVLIYNTFHMPVHNDAISYRKVIEKDVHSRSRYTKLTSIYRQIFTCQRKKQATSSSWSSPSLKSTVEDVQSPRVNIPKKARYSHPPTQAPSIFPRSRFLGDLHRSSEVFRANVLA